MLTNIVWNTWKYLNSSLKLNFRHETSLLIHFSFRNCGFNKDCGVDQKILAWAIGSKTTKSKYVYTLGQFPLSAKQHSLKTFFSFSADKLHTEGWFDQAPSILNRYEFCTIVFRPKVSEHIEHTSCFWPCQLHIQRYMR